jgi:hypothetical protein
MNVSLVAATPILAADHPGTPASARSRRRLANLSRVCVFVLLLGVASCGGGSGGESVATFPPLPQGVTVWQGGTHQFETDVDVTWTVLEGAAGGSITGAGLYTAPATSGTFIVVAKRRSTGATRTATVIVPPVVISLRRETVTATTGETIPLAQFVDVSGTVNSGLAWAILEAEAGGGITSAGDYSAPGSFGSFHVVATSLANHAVTATFTMNVGKLTVNIRPPFDTLGPAGVRRFQGSASAFDAAVTWDVLEGPTGGLMQGDEYTAPKTPGTFHVIATSARDSSVSATAIVTVVAAGFVPAANMFESRIGPTATLLASGKVLIAGGECIGYWDYQECPTASAEIYDPVSGAFSRTGGMAAARSTHTATLLPNGKVLITGGGIASAELFDPATGTFAMTGNMSAVRSAHAATLLSNGRVLITGGYSVDSSLSTAEVYDPQTGTFSPAAGTGMTRARTRHTATRLTNGNVLIAGGDGSDDSSTTAELYDPVRGTFTATGSMGDSRYASAATLLDNGKVLITGGRATAEIYDPAVGGFSNTGNMMTARGSPTSHKLPNGTVLIIGGDCSWSPGYACTAEIFEPTTGIFVQTGSMTGARVQYAAVTLDDGRVLVAGGTDTTLTEVYQ